MRLPKDDLEWHFVGAVILVGGDAVVLIIHLVRWILGMEFS